MELKKLPISVCALASCLCQTQAEESTLPDPAVHEAVKPNILFILCDDLGWTDVGYNGAKYHLTPNIDKLAKQSLILDRAYARPTCSPSRASLFTGLNAAHTGIYGDIGSHLCCGDIGSHLHCWEI